MQDTPIPGCPDRLSRLNLADLAGIAISGACLIHCLATPILLAVLPLAGECFASPWVHLSLAAILMPLALVSLLAGYRRHHRLRALSMGLCGLASISLVLLHDHFITPTCCTSPELQPTTLLNLAGSALLVAAHTLNLRDGFHPC